MKLVSVLSLVGTNIEGRKADIRARNADGSLKYASEQKKPIVVTMIKAVIEKRKHCTPTPVEWLYWYYEGHGCGYSGHRMDGEQDDPNFINLYA